jgi:predicted phosphate transport protein (TIGR00153 family)
MKFNTIFSFFVPRSREFIPIFKETAEVLVETSGLLRELLSQNDPEETKELCRLIKAEEIKGDRLTNRIFAALNGTFITPFDREDINALTDALDDINDNVNRVARKILLYSPKKLPQHTLTFAEIIHKGALEIQKAVNELDRVKHTDEQLREHYREIKRLEEEADGVYERSIMNLFHEEIDTIELIKIKEIIQELEKTVNRVDDAGKVFKTIFVKYA